MSSHLFGKTYTPPRINIQDRVALIPVHVPSGRLGGYFENYLRSKYSICLPLHKMSVLILAPRFSLPCFLAVSTIINCYIIHAHIKYGKVQY